MNINSQKIDAKIMIQALFDSEIRGETNK